MTRTTTPPLAHPLMQNRLVAVLTDLALGAAIALGQVPWGLWGISVAALALMVWRMAQAPLPRTAFWRGFFAGAGYFALALSWIVEPFQVDAARYGWMAPFALVLMAMGGGLFWAVPAWVAARLTHGWKARGAGFAAGLVLSDWLRGWIFTGFPWVLIGHIWLGTPVAQMAAYGGALGLSGLTMLLAALPTLMWHLTKPKPARLAPGLLAAAVLLSAGWAAGLSSLSAPMPPDRDIRLRLVQPNARQDLKWDPVWAGEFYTRLLDHSAAPAAHGRLPDAVIWPEAAVNFLLDSPGMALQQIADAAQAPVLMGIQRSDGTRYYNSFAEIGAEGQVGPVYDKAHLVPFGEYIPWGDTLADFGISAFAAQAGFGYTPGPGPQVLHMAGLPAVQVLICYEAIFPAAIRATGTRPEWLLQITNDAWFGNYSGPYQHLAQARLRAIETGLPMIRVAITGVSAVIDAKGRVRDRLGLNVAGHIDAALPAPLAPTIWWRLGDLPAIVLACLALLAASVIGRRETRRAGS